MQSVGRGAVRWEAVIIGVESGAVIPLDFIEWRYLHEAEAWAHEMNTAPGKDARTRYGFREIEDDRNP